MAGLTCCLSPKNPPRFGQGGDLSRTLGVEGLSGSAPPSAAGFHTVDREQPAIAGRCSPTRPQDHVLKPAVSHWGRSR